MAVDQRIEQLDNDARKLGRLSYNDVKTVFEIIKAKRMMNSLFIPNLVFVVISLANYNQF